jgi:hypothetical protein
MTRLFTEQPWKRSWLASVETYVKVSTIEKKAKLVNGDLHSVRSKTIPNKSMVIQDFTVFKVFIPLFSIFPSLLIYFSIGSLPFWRPQFCQALTFSLYHLEFSFPQPCSIQVICFCSQKLFCQFAILFWIIR